MKGELENLITELKRQIELIQLNSGIQNHEKEKRADELNIANKELAFQNQEKEKRANELIIANKELAFQNEEKGKRAAELFIANKELTFQNEEKVKRANEIFIANKELAFQNHEKEKRADELNIANKELAFQNQEKEKRANELIIVNKELEQLIQLNADKDRFISILAHDLRSPFNSILGFLNLLVENIHIYDISEIEKQIRIVYSSSQSAYNLLEELILWTQSQSGKLPFEQKKLNFSEICNGVIKVFNTKANTKNITINHTRSKVVTVFADVNMLKTILRNLISNALKFCNPGGQINICAEKTGANITISVSDNGIGIASETLNKLFDDTQINSTIGTSAEKGTGLGLVLCKEFVEKHNGSIWAESELGKGSIFKFMLPIEEKLLALTAV